MEFGDRLFWGIMIFIGINLFWLGVLQKFVPIWVGTIIGILAAVAFIIYCPRPKTKENGMRDW